MLVVLLSMFFFNFGKMLINFVQNHPVMTEMWRNKKSALVKKQQCPGPWGRPRGRDKNCKTQSMDSVAPSAAEDTILA
jgi:hypothetical protein